MAMESSWAFYQPRGWVYPSALEELGIAASTAHRGHSIVASVEDSDFCYVAAASTEGIVARLLFNR